MRLIPNLHILFFPHKSQHSPGTLDQLCPRTLKCLHSDAQLLFLQTRNTDRADRADRAIMIKRGQMHNREIIRTRPQCMNPSTSTQLCQTAWSIIFSNSCGLESDYRAPSVAQTSAPEQVTSWLFTNMSLRKFILLVRIWCPNCARFASVLLNLLLPHGVTSLESDSCVSERYITTQRGFLICDCWVKCDVSDSYIYD